jgi:hypothetical protein
MTDTREKIVGLRRDIKEIVKSLLFFLWNDDRSQELMIRLVSSKMVPISWLLLVYNILR